MPGNLRPRKVDFRNKFCSRVCLDCRAIETSRPMLKIAIIGLGGIGSTFAFHLAHAGHNVTAVARGERLLQLQADSAVVMADGRRAVVRVSAALDETAEWDLVLVTVLAHQVAPLLPVLRASRAKTVLFCFNTFEPLSRLRDEVGAERFACGFPGIMANIVDGKLQSTVLSRGQLTIVTEATWSKVFSAAGIPSTVHRDMENWQRTHAVFAVSVMAVLLKAYERQAGATWGEASDSALALHEGLMLVRRLEGTVTPLPIAILGHLPVRVVALLLWAISRVPSVRARGVLGPNDARGLIDQMRAIAGPGAQIPALLAIRP